MYIKNINITQENVIIYYPTLYISSSSNNSINIRQITLSGNQNLEKNNTIELITEPKFILNLIKEN
jgi:hypothetical protein